MARTLNDVIDEQIGKSVVLTVGELFDIFLEAFHAGHNTSRYSPNVGGDAKRAFISSEVFEKVREQA